MFGNICYIVLYCLKSKDCKRTELDITLTERVNLNMIYIITFQWAAFHLRCLSTNQFKQQNPYLCLCLDVCINISIPIAIAKPNNTQRIHNNPQSLQCNTLRTVAFNCYIYGLFAR